VLNRSQDSDLVECVFLLLLAEVLERDLLQGVCLVVCLTGDLEHLAVGASAQLGHDVEVVNRGRGKRCSRS
jgi:hypothetical protein